MVAGALSLCGAWTGTTFPGGPENPRGFYEHVALRENVTKQILTFLECDPLGVNKLPRIETLPEITDLGAAVRGFIERDGYQQTSRWLYKDAKLTLIWPIFARAFPLAQWIVVRRDEKSFIASCLKTGFMVQHSEDPKFWQALAAQYNERLDLLHQNLEGQVFELSTPEIAAGDFSSLENLVGELQLKFDPQQIAEFVDSGHWHNRPSTN